jgi:hypothetical protein
MVKIVPVARKRIAEGKIECRESKNKFFHGFVYMMKYLFIPRFRERTFFQSGPKKYKNVFELDV